MAFKKTEKEIIRAIVKYGEKEKSIADILNRSGILEKRGIVLLPKQTGNHIFLDKSKYNDSEDKKGLGYVAELISLIDMLVEKKYLVPIPHHFGNVLVVGRKEAKYATIGKISLDQGQEFILGENDKRDFVNNNGQQTHWSNTFSEQHCHINHIMHSWYAVSEELKELVKHNFRTPEEIRFCKQQWATWISIFVAIAIGMLGLFK